MRTAGYGKGMQLRPATPGFQSRLGVVLARTRSVWRALRNRVSANSLYELDDRQLDDIGLTRHDVIVAMERSGVLDDPSLLLSRAARERSRTRFAKLAHR